MFLEESETRQQNLKDTRDRAKNDKETAIQLATQPLGFCLFIAIFILAAVVVPPALIVLL